jgi:hypothetical protein
VFERSLLPVLPVDVRDISETNPPSFELSQNYPNPFNPTTVIRFRVPVACEVRLTVHDISGAEVLTIVNEKKPAGNYDVTFDATGLASGVYLGRYAAGTHVMTTKMILIR